MAPEYADKHGCYGEYSWDTATIALDTRLERTLLEQVFMHELCHACFEACGRDDLSENEALVDAMGSLLHQALTYQSGELVPNGTE
jgi:hypothetical protein